MRHQVDLLWSFRSHESKAKELQEGNGDTMHLDIKRVNTQQESGNSDEEHAHTSNGIQEEGASAEAKSDSDEERRRHHGEGRVIDLRTNFRLSGPS